MKKLSGIGVFNKDDVVFLPSVSVKTENNSLIDDIQIDYLAEKLGVRVSIVDPDPENLYQELFQNSF